MWPMGLLLKIMTDLFPCILLFYLVPGRRFFIRLNCYIGFKQFVLNDFWFNVLKETMKTDVLKMLQKLIQIRND